MSESRVASNMKLLDGVVAHTRSRQIHATILPLHVFDLLGEPLSGCVAIPFTKSHPPPPTDLSFCGRKGEDLFVKGKPEREGLEVKSLRACVREREAEKQVPG